ncbi:MAG: SMP-30/gluconolactonase/LRE family protein [Verrucomicrobia subdivision 3 bacterium]|nr:SMP-30/gluconolactonase/LRE family protein [Limisphaerales bacterium]
MPATYQAVWPRANPIDMGHSNDRIRLMHSLRYLLFILASFPLLAADDYKLGPDSMPQEGVPRGQVTKHSWTSKIFPGTVRDYWVYVPAQYDAARPACVMVFQDGGGYVNTNGQYRVPTVFDNLIHRKEMPVTIGIFINPGVVPAAHSNALPRFNRSYEYDGLGDTYVRFLLEEILPEVGKQHNLTTNAAARAIAGASSGAICAFTAAWERPDAFSKVFSTIGTYVGLRGGNDYPTLIRKTEPKPIRVFLQDGSGDLNIYGGNWWIANQDMLSALQFAGYDVKHEWGDGGHNGRHGGAIFPEAMRWLWRDHPQPVKAGQQSRQAVMSILIPGEEWQLVSAGHRFTEGPVANEGGELFFTDIPNNKIHKVSADGNVSVFAEETGGANGLKLGPDGRLYACANGKKEIVAYDARGRATAVAEDVNSNDLVVNHKGDIYFTDPGNKQVWLVKRGGEKKVVDKGMGRPNGIALSPDQGLLLVADTGGQFVYSFQVQSGGELAYKQRYFHLHLPDGATESGADGMTVDTNGTLYVTTAAGLQFCDQAGRVNGIISKPQKAWLANATFGGPDLSYLYVTCGDKVFRRKTKTRGVLPWKAPFMPRAPRL